jgi:hypothetical protein
MSETPRAGVAILGAGVALHAIAATLPPLFGMRDKVTSMANDLLATGITVDLLLGLGAAMPRRGPPKLEKSRWARANHPNLYCRCSCGRWARVDGCADHPAPAAPHRPLRQLWRAEQRIRRQTP